MSFIRNVSYTFGTKVFILLIGLGTSIIIARTLGPAGRGLISLSILSAVMVFQLANMGIGTGSGYFLGRRRIPVEVLAGNWLSLSLIIGAVVTALALALVPVFAPRLLVSVPPLMIYIALLGVPGLVLTFNFQMLCRADSDFRGYNVIELSQKSIFIVLFIAAIVLLSGNKLTAAVSIYAFSVTVTAVIALSIWARRVRLRPMWTPDLIRSAMRFGVMGHLTNFLGFLNLRFDLLLVNIYLDPASVGFYSIAVVIAEKLWYLPDALHIVLYPKVAHGSDEEANVDTARVSRQAVVVVSISCLAVLILGRPAIRLLYSDIFLPSVAPLMWLLPGVFAAGLARILGSDLLARGYPHVNMWAGLIAFAVNITCNVLMIPRLGISGAAIATSVSYTFHFIIILIAFRRITGLSTAVILVPVIADMKIFTDAVMKLTGRKGK